MNIGHVFLLVCSVASASGALENIVSSLLQTLEPVCLGLTEVPRECDATLEESFTSTYPTVKGNAPTTKVYLFTPDNPDKAEQLHLCRGGLPPGSTYARDADTEIFIHGWLDGVCRTQWMREMKEELRQRGRYNVILVDWTWGNTPEYLTAGYNCRIVGEQIGFVINNIMRQTGSSPEKFHVIGHSFGGIASGYVGRGAPGLRRITALDPAYYPYDNTPPNTRVTYRDARIVDVIHTNANVNFALGIGDPRQLGHADFYPNGGEEQPYCYLEAVQSLLTLDLFYGIAELDLRLCSHIQCIEFYKESINPKGYNFIGVASSSYEEFLQNGNNSRICHKDWAVMGMDYELYINTRERKSYYLTTAKKYPQCDARFHRQNK